MKLHCSSDGDTGPTFAHIGDMRLSASLARVGLASLVGALATFCASRAEAANPCDPTALTCSTGTAKLEARIKTQLPTQIDSGMMGTGPIKIRTRFTIDPS